MAVVNSEIPLRMVSELHVRRVGCSERWGIRWLVTSSTQSPPQKNTLDSEIVGSLSSVYFCGGDCVEDVTSRIKAFVFKFFASKAA